MKLEELARQSSDAARVSVARLEIPPIGSDVPHRSRTSILAGVAVTALIVGGLAVLARDRTDGDASADAQLPAVTDVPRLGLDLDGWSVNFASSFENLPTDQSRPDIDYYGDADSDDPFSGGDLLISANPGADPTSRPTEAPGDRTVALRGTRATVSSSTDLGLPNGATAVTWYEYAADGTATEIVLVSRSFDVDRLIAIAEALAIDTDGVRPGDDLGLDRVATASGTPFDLFSASSDGYLVGYSDQAGTDLVVISGRLGNLVQEANILRWWTDEVTTVEIGGRPGLLATFDGLTAGLGPIVSWSPIDGVVTTVSRFGPDDSLDPVALARTVYEIDDATWADYLTTAEATRAGTDEFDEIFGRGDGKLADAEYSWVLGLQADGLCFTLHSGNENSGSCQQRTGIEAPSGGARIVDNGFGATVAQVVIVADPAVEQIVETRGGYDITRVEADGVSWFVAIGDAAVQPSFDVIVNGTIVDTLEAGIEAVGLIEPALAANPAAVELGIADMTVVAGDGRAEFSWLLGLNGPDLCLVTDGAEPTARCNVAGDVIVFAPVVVPDGVQTFVVVVDAPSCVDAIRFEGSIVDFSANESNGQHTYDIFAITDGGRSRQLRLDVAERSELVELPAREGTADFPAQLCDG